MMTRTNNSSKQAIVGLRRKNQSRAKIGGLLYDMAKENKLTFTGSKAICEYLKMDIRALNKHIGFRIYEQTQPGEKKQSNVLALSKMDREIIDNVENVYRRFSMLPQDHQKICHYVFLHLLKNEQQ